MKAIEESSSDSLRSRVSSPGMPNTCRTPSASRHSTNRSDAFLEAPRLLSRPLPAVPAGASAAKKIYVIKGAGFGHGVGISQYGADGFAQHGWDYRQILGHY